MTINLDTLRKTAEAATPGPWEARQGAVAPGKKVVGPRKPNDVGRGPVVLMQPIFWDERSAANADHIATFDPPTVLALLSRLEQAEQAVQRVREMATELRDTPASPESPKYARLLIEGAQAAGADMLHALDGDGHG